MGAYSQLDESFWSEYHTFGLLWQPGEYIRWFIDGTLVYELNKEALQAKSNGTYTVPERLIPRGTDVHHRKPGSVRSSCQGMHMDPDSFGAVKEDDLPYPSQFKIDYVRVYQNPENVSTTCNPPDHPTEQYIACNRDLYLIREEEQALVTATCQGAASCVSEANMDYSVELQGVSLVVLSFRDEAAATALADLVAAHGGILGAAVCCAEKGADPSDDWTTCEQDRDELLDRIFRLAKERNLDLDFHTDENGNELARGLRYVALKAEQWGYQGRVVCGHCCSLAFQPPEELAKTLEAVRRAGVTVVSLPLVNQWTQDRSHEGGRTPRWRGITLLHELRQAGIPTAISSDNVRDQFYAYGDLDMLEVFTQAFQHLLSRCPLSVVYASSSQYGLRQRRTVDWGGGMWRRPSMRLPCAPAAATLFQHQTGLA
ncbi:hypothetical protein ABPG75_003631 [Micractinium tetrahymenae]